MTIHPDFVNFCYYMSIEGEEEFKSSHDSMDSAMEQLGILRKEFPNATIQIFKIVGRIGPIIYNN